MSIRRDPGPVVLAAASRLHACNQRHPWSHNDHFHGWILRRLPARRQLALDIGCGTGALVARLAEVFDHVDAVDPDEGMAGATAARFRGDGRVTVRAEVFADVPRPVGGYDLVTMVASLHHMALEPALVHAKELLAPGGRLLVVGLAQVSSRSDAAIDLLSAFANPVVGFVKHPRAVAADRQVERSGPPMPVRDPAQTYDEVRDTARRLLPGARLRRRLFFRYTLAWTA